MARRTRQQRFVDEYLVDLNGHQAAVRAGYSPKTARVIAATLLTKPNITAAIAKGQAERAERTHVTQDQVLYELALLNASDVRHYRITDTGDLTLAEGAPPLAYRAVSSVKKKVRQTVDGDMTIETEIRLWDKVGALRLTAQHLGMLTDKLEIKADLTYHDLTTALDAALEEAYASRNGHSTAPHD